ncbi:MAG: restriction endonuclease subunit S, partial [Succinivibrio sp.]|nr:restriction endonuclease subunit S [Succinivibrio sp.]
MSRVDNLINRYDYEKILYKRVDELFNISRGKVMSKDYIKENQGDYPVYSSQTENNGVLGYISTYAYDGEYLTWTTDGANAGTVFYRSGRFSVTNVCGLLEVINSTILNAKYAFYILNMIAPNYVNRGMGNPKLMSNVMGKIKLPVPPLSIQEEIVRILDSFTELTAELTAELAARKQQYKVYCRKLIEELSDAKDTCIGDLGSWSGGSTPSMSNKEFWEDGTFPWVSSKDMKVSVLTDT